MYRFPHEHVLSSLSIFIYYFSADVNFGNNKSSMELVRIFENIDEHHHYHELAFTNVDF